LTCRDNANFFSLYQYKSEILNLSRFSESHEKAAVFLLSQIAINRPDLPVLQSLKILFEDGTLSTKLEVVKALSAIKDTQSLLHNEIHSTFAFLELVKIAGLENTVNLFEIYAIRYFSHQEGLQVFDFLVKRFKVEQDLESLDLLIKVLRNNAFLTKSLSSDFLRSLLQMIIRRKDLRRQIIGILEIFILNNEKSFAVLIPVKFFDYLLPLLQSEFMIDVIMLFSNLAGEAEEVVEMMILNKTFEEVFLLLNKFGDSRLDREVVYLVHNSLIVASQRQAQYFVDIGVVQMLVNLEALVNENVHRLIFRTLKRIKKLCPVRVLGC
jgi:hypothetical protein